MSAALPGYLWLVILGAIGSWVFGYGTGSNDVANAFGTSVGSKALTLRQAVLIAIVFEFGGALLLGRVSTATIAGGIAQVSTFAHAPEVYAYGMMIALWVAGTWNIVASYFEFNVSSTHSIIGSIIGFALVFAGGSGVKWADPDPQSFPPYKGVVPIVVAWFSSPILTAFAAAVIFILLRTLVLRRRNAYTLSFWLLPFLVTITVFVCIFFVFTKGIAKSLPSGADWTNGKSAWVSVLVAVGCGALAAAIALPLIARSIRKKFQTQLPVMEPTGSLGMLPKELLKQSPEGPNGGTSNESTSTGPHSLAPAGAVMMEEGASPAGGSPAGGSPREGPSSAESSFQRVSSAVVTPGHTLSAPATPGQAIPEDPAVITGHHRLTAQEREGLAAAAAAAAKKRAKEKVEEKDRELHERHMRAVLTKTTLSGASDSEDSTASKSSWTQSIAERTRSGLAFLKKILLRGTSVDIHECVEVDPIVAAIHANAEVFDPHVEFSFAYLQVFSAICVIFAHGAGEVGYMAGPLASIWMIYTEGELVRLVKAPIWVILIAALGLVAGLATYGYNVTRAMGVRLAKLSPTRGFCAELSTALVILICSQYGLPVSSSQCITGGIIGVGCVEGRLGVNWRFFCVQFASWVGTIFVTGGLTALFFAQGYFAPGKFALDDSHMYQAQLVNLTGHLYNNFQAQLVPLQAASLSNTLATLPAATYTSLNQTISTGQGQVKKIANGTQQTVTPDAVLFNMNQALSLYNNYTVLTIGQAKVYPGAQTGVCNAPAAAPTTPAPCHPPDLLPPHGP